MGVSSRRRGDVWSIFGKLRSASMSEPVYRFSNAMAPVLQALNARTSWVTRYIQLTSSYNLQLELRLYNHYWVSYSHITEILRNIPLKCMYFISLLTMRVAIDKRKLLAVYYIHLKLKCKRILKISSLREHVMLFEHFSTILLTSNTSNQHIITYCPSTSLHTFLQLLKGVNIVPLNILSLFIHLLLP